MTTNQTNRQLQLVDVENLLGNPRPLEVEVRECALLWHELVSTPASSQTVIACNHGAAKAVFWGWDQSARRLVRSGHDGADEALMQVLREENVDKRFTQVVIGSGDGIFADAATWLASHGLEVTVVSRPTALSKRLELVASHNIAFERPGIIVPAMALGRAA